MGSLEKCAIARHSSRILSGVGSASSVQVCISASASCTRSIQYLIAHAAFPQSHIIRPVYALAPLSLRAGPGAIHKATVHSLTRCSTFNTTRPSTPPSRIEPPRPSRLAGSTATALPYRDISFLPTVVLSTVKQESTEPKRA